MSSKEISRPVRRPVRRGPGGPGGPHGGGMPGEKPKEFKKTLFKTLRYMRKNLVAIIIAFILAIGGVVATILVPDIMGQATDELMTGVLRKQIYETVKVADSLVTGQMMEQAALSPDTTLVEWLAAHPEDIPQEDTGIDEEDMAQFGSVTIGQMVDAHSATTLGEYMARLGMASVFDSLPSDYSDMVYHTSLLEGEPGIDVRQVGRLHLEHVLAV